MEVVLALLSALLFALGSVLQQKAGAAAPSIGTSSGLLLRMARRPVWLAGIGCDGLGFLAQAAALGVGRLDVVQPLLVTSVVFALPLGAWLSGQRVGRRTCWPPRWWSRRWPPFWPSPIPPAGAAMRRSAGGWSPARCASGCVRRWPWAARAAHGGRRAALLGLGAGILFALSAALTKAVVGRLDGGLLHTVLGWQVPALIVVGYVSLTVNQLSLDAGALAATVATSTALDPVTSLVLGLTLFGESLRASAGGVIVTVLALAVAVAAMGSSPAPRRRAEIRRRGPPPAPPGWRR